MKRVLFVDDEPKILDGLRRLLRRQRHEWEMTFVDSGAAGCEALAREDFDVLVADMRMPGMDGAALLSHTQAHHPTTVRIVLSGHTELEAALRAIPIAHQFLTKPCDADSMREIITRACDLQSVLEAPDLRRCLGSLGTLPAVPRIYSRLVSALTDPEISIEDVAAIVEQDPAIATKILQLVNSSYFGTSFAISSLRQATTHLGLNMIRNLTLSMEVFGTFERHHLPAGFSIEREQQHATLTARLARRLVPDRTRSEAAFLAGILHDVGKLVLATGPPQQLVLVEDGTTSVTHAEIGGYLLGLWGMPYPIVEAVVHHHDPDRVEQSSFDVLGAVHVADALAHEHGPEEPGANDESHRLDLAYLESVGVAHRLPEWREMAATEAAAQPV